VCIENWGSRFSTFRYVHDVDPFLEYNHVAMPPNDDYVHRTDCNRSLILIQTVNPFVIYSIVPDRIITCYWRRNSDHFGQSVVDLAATHLAIELSPQSLQYGRPLRTRALGEEGVPCAKMTKA